MIAGLIPLIAKFWKPALFAAVIAGAFVYRAVLTHELASARNETARIKQQMTQLAASNSQFQAAVRDCNTQVSSLQMKAAAIARQAESRQAEAVQIAEKRQNRANQEAADLERAKIAPDCRNAIAWGNRQGPELGEW